MQLKAPDRDPILKRLVCSRVLRATAWIIFPAIAGSRQHVALPGESESDDRRLRHPRERNLAASLPPMINAHGLHRHSQTQPQQ